MMPRGALGGSRRRRAARQGERPHRGARRPACARSARGRRVHRRLLARVASVARRRRSMPPAIIGSPWRSPSPRPARTAPTPSLGAARGRRVVSRVSSTTLDAARSAVTVDKIISSDSWPRARAPWRARSPARLGWRAEDVDELIEARERRTIADIFARHGEPYFRARRARDPAPAPAAPPRRRRHRRRNVHGSPRIGPRSTSTACRSGSTSPSKSCCRASRPTAGGRWPRIARDGTAVRHAAGRLRACAISRRRDRPQRRGDRRAHRCRPRALPSGTVTTTCAT